MQTNMREDKKDEIARLETEIAALRIVMAEEEDEEPCDEEPCDEEPCAEEVDLPSCL